MSRGWLADAARYLEADAIVASTATATPRVAADIVRRLGLSDPLKVATGFDRPNISFVAARPAGSAPEGPCLPPGHSTSMETS